MAQLEELNATLEQVRDKILNKWTETTLREYQQHEQIKHQQEMNKHQEELATLKVQLEQYKQKVSSRIKLKEEHGKKHTELSEALALVQEETDALLLEKESLERDLRVAQEEHKKHLEVLETHKKSGDQVRKELQKSIDCFEDRIGLRFKKLSDNRLQVVLTCVDLKDPTFPFLFCVKVNQDGTYTDVDPEIPDLEELVAKLNKTNNLRSFIITMRQRFKALT